MNIPDDIEDFVIQDSLKLQKRQISNEAFGKYEVYMDRNFYCLWAGSVIHHPLKTLPAGL